MHKGAKTRIADIPHAATPFGKFHRLHRAQLVAHAAPFAAQLVNNEALALGAHGVKPAQLGATPAGGAERGVYSGRVAGNKRLLLFDLRI